MRFVKVIPDPLGLASYINTETIIGISPVYDNDEHELKYINISTTHGTYEHYIGRHMFVDDANNVVEGLINKITCAETSNKIIIYEAW